MLRSTLEYKILSTFSDNIGNIISIDLSLNDFTVKVINIYAPNSPEFFSQIQDIILSGQMDHTMVSGDYNLVLNPSLDTTNYKNVNNLKSR